MYSNDVKKLLYKEANGKCALCGREMTLDQVTLDHIIPLAKNGPDRVDNLQICCKGCNLLKGAALPEDFANRVNAIFLYQMEYIFLWILFFFLSPFSFAASFHTAFAALIRATSSGSNHFHTIFCVTVSYT